MKTFSEISRELNEAKFKVPSGNKELKREIVKAGSKKFELVFVQNKKRKVEVYLDGTAMGQEFKDIKAAEKELKDIKGVLLQMGEDFSIGEFKEFFNEIN